MIETYLYCFAEAAICMVISCAVVGLGRILYDLVERLFPEGAVED